MADTAGTNANRGPWIIAGAILLSAALIIGVLLYQRSQDQKCEDWQAEVRRAQAVFEGIEGFPLIVPSDLEETRPSGCPDP